MNKLVPLAQALAMHVRPGMHLHFASTPSRSNAAVRELARRFRGRAPGFVLSTSGFHSSAHLLALLRLGRRYVGCFFGDNYPTPRPNRLYQELSRSDATLEHWSLWTYVSALRAAALGHSYAVTRSLSGTTLGQQLTDAGKFIEIPDPRDPSSRLGLLMPMAPDVVFLHAAAGDAAGNALFSPPYGEGFYAAFAARVGVVVTVERILDAHSLRRVPHLVPLPPHRVLAICEEPFGAHPQSFHFAPAEPALASYRDDFEHYRLWRELAGDVRLFQRFAEQVLDAPDGAAGYREFVGGSRLESLRVEAPGQERARRGEAPRMRSAPRLVVAAALTPSDKLVLLAARTIARRVRAAGLLSMLAGIGHSFSAARLAKLILGDAGEQVELMIETGFTGIDAETAHPFLLSQSNVASAARLSSVEAVLGALTCGAENLCIGIIGAAEVDVGGNVNSSYAGGELLVGSGGANDIASAAREVVVLTRADPKRMVAQVEYVTSPGQRVLCVATDACVFERPAPGARWLARDIEPGALPELRLLRERCGWDFELPDTPLVAPPPSPLEVGFLARLRQASEPERAPRAALQEGA